VQEETYKNWFNIRVHGTDEEDDDDQEDDDE
jgi:hypothetical protein